MTDMLVRTMPGQLPPMPGQPPMPQPREVAA